MNYSSYRRAPGVPPQLLQMLQQAQAMPQQNPAQQVYQSAEGGPMPSRYISHGTGAPGRADNIDAKLSENEYVIDAETMALLGDGNPDAGAAKMDDFRKNIRRKKGKYLTHGEISPDAGDPMQYLSVEK